MLTLAKAALISANVSGLHASSLLSLADWSCAEEAAAGDGTGLVRVQGGW